MGLDMYLKKRKKGSKDKEIGYWRKHSNLHGLMEKTYLQRGGSEEFNCVELELEKADVVRIIGLSVDNRLESESGFLWGESNRKDDYDTVQIMMTALDAIKKGYKIIYEAWY